MRELSGPYQECRSVVFAGRGHGGWRGGQRAVRQLHLGSKAPLLLGPIKGCAQPPCGCFHGNRWDPRCSFTGIVEAYENVILGVHQHESSAKSNPKNSSCHFHLRGCLF